MVVDIELKERLHHKFKIWSARVSRGTGSCLPENRWPGLGSVHTKTKINQLIEKASDDGQVNCHAEQKRWEVYTPSTLMS